MGPPEFYKDVAPLELRIMGPPEFYRDVAPLELGTLGIVEVQTLAWILEDFGNLDVYKEMLHWSFEGFSGRHRSFTLVTPK